MWLSLAEFAMNNVLLRDNRWIPPWESSPLDPCPPNLSYVQNREFFPDNQVIDTLREGSSRKLKALAARSIERYEENAKATPRP